MQRHDQHTEQHPVTQKGQLFSLFISCANQCCDQQNHQKNQLKKSLPLYVLNYHPCVRNTSSTYALLQRWEINTKSGMGAMRASDVALQAMIVSNDVTNTLQRAYEASANYPFLV